MVETVTSEQYQELNDWFIQQPREVIELIAWRAGMRALPYIVHELNLAQANADDAILGAFHALGATQIKLSGAESKIPERAHAHFRTKIRDLDDEPRAPFAFAMDSLRMCFLADNIAEAANNATGVCAELYRAEPELWSQVKLDRKHYVERQSVPLLMRRSLINRNSIDESLANGPYGSGSYGAGSFGGSFLERYASEWRSMTDFFVITRNQNWKIWIDWAGRQKKNFQPDNAFAYAFTRMTEDDWQADVSDANRRLEPIQFIRSHSLRLRSSFGIAGA